jgi:hypothetical protein
MSSLPPALDFPSMEEAVCQQWKDGDTFRRQEALSLERGDPVRAFVKRSLRRAAFARSAVVYDEALR